MRSGVTLSGASSGRVNGALAEDAAVRRRRKTKFAHLMQWGKRRGHDGGKTVHTSAARPTGQRSRLLFEALENRCLLSGNLLISEFVADNNAGLVDGYGKNSDWIELYNATDEPLLLRDYYLTDNARNLAKWRFPDITLAPRSYVVVFASGKGEDYPEGYVQDPAGYWHTNFKLEKSGEYLATTWRDPSSGTIYVQHEYAPVYPQQLGDISYGLTYLDTGARLIELGDSAKLLVPTDDSLGSAWISPSYSDAAWPLAGPLGVGYEVVVAVPESGSGLFYGPYGPGGTWNLYEVVNIPRTWIDAHSDALSRVRAGVAGHLVTISSLAENLFIQSICGGLSNDPWIGLTDSDTFAALGAQEYGNTSSWPLPPAGTPPTSTQRGAGFVWVTGEPFVFQRWNSGQPDDASPGQDGVFLSRSSGFWSDDRSGEGAQTGVYRPYIVEYELGLPDRAFLAVQRVSSATPLTSIDQAVELLQGGAGTTVAATVVNFIDPQNAAPGRFTNNAAFPADTSADDNHFAVKVSGAIRIPTSGSWTFHVNSDEGFRLRIRGATFVAAYGTGTTIAGDTLQFSGMRTAADSLGVATLAAGDYEFELYYFESSGAAGLELSAAYGAKSVWDSSFKLVGDYYNGGLMTLGFENLIGVSLQEAMKGRASSVYLRRSFTVEDPTLFDSLILNMKYDDGFVAYLNGVEVARSDNVPTSPRFDSTAGSDHPTGLARHGVWFDITAYKHLLQPGMNVLAVHGMNRSADDSDFFLMPELLAIGWRPDVSRPTYFVKPTPAAPNTSAALGVVADTKFSIDRGFYDTPQWLVITTATPGAEIRYTLDGSTPTAAGVAKTVASLTRSGSTATAMVLNHGFVAGNSVQIVGADQPEYNGVFVITSATANTFQFQVSGMPASPATGTITARLTQAACYTYTGPILIDRTTTVRAAAFKPGWTPSDVDTQTYIFLDDVVRQSADNAPPHVGEPDIINARFDTSAQGFTFTPNAFGTSSPATTSGEWGAAYGRTGGGLRLYLTGPSAVPTAAAFTSTFTVGRSLNYGISFWFRMTQGPGFSSTETSQVIVTIDGVRYGLDVNTTVLSANGDNDNQIDVFGWHMCGLSAKLAPGAHSIAVGVYRNAASGADDWVELLLDDVKISNWPGNWAPWLSSVPGQVLDYGMDPKVLEHPVWGPRLKDALTSIPTISLVTELPNLFDPSTGIYVNASGSGPAWERPVSVELINPDGSKGFQVDAGLRIRGGFSVTGTNPKHAFRLFFRDQYGAAKLQYPLFGDEGAKEFDHLDLRCSQNYSWAFGNSRQNAEVREVFSRDLGLAMGQVQTHSRFYHLYINGQYWGLYQSEERPEASFAATYLGGDKEDYDIIKHSGGGIEATDGTLDTWWQLTKTGFRVTTYQANVAVPNLTTALAVLADQSKWSAVTTNYYDRVNFTNNGGDGRFVSNNAAFPGITASDADNFVVEVLGTIYIPMAGEWTFGVNCNDGFLLQLSDGTNTFTSSYPNARTTGGDTLATFNIPAAGPYRLRLVFFEYTGAAGLELFAAKGRYASFNAQAFRMVGDVTTSGFRVTTYTANIPVTDLATADSVIADPSKRTGAATVFASALNFLDNTGASGSGGNFGFNAAFPGDTTSDDNNFVVEAVGLIEIPAAGQWTFGANCNDGFRLTLTRGVYSDTLSLDGTRSSAVNALKVFNLPEAGTYQVRVVYFENVGSAEFELFYAQGSHASFNSSFQLVRDVGIALPYSGPGPFYWEIQGLNPDGSRNPNLPVLLNVDSLIDYMIVIFYTGDGDAPITRAGTAVNNWYGGCNRNGGDGFHFFSHDAEHTLSRGLVDRTGPWPIGWGNFIRTQPLYVHQELMMEPEYRLRFADRVRKYFFYDGLLTPTAAAARFRALAEQLGYSQPDAGPMLAESARWGDSKKSPKYVSNITYSGTTATVTLSGHGYVNGDTVYISGANQPQYNGSFTIFNVTSNTFQYTMTGVPSGPATGQITAFLVYSKNTWLDAVNYELNTFFPNRTNVVLNQFRNAKRYSWDRTELLAAPLYPATAAPDFTVNGAVRYGGQVQATDLIRFTAPAGTIYYTLDGSDPRLPGGALSPTAIQYTGTPITLSQSTLIKARALSGSDWSALSEAWFYVGTPASASNLVITEINYNPPEPSAAELAALPGVTAQRFEFIELLNVADTWIDLTNVRFERGIRFDFTAAGLTRLEPGQYLVLAADPAAMAVRYPGVAVAGQFSGALDNSGERLVLSDRAGTPIADFSYRDSGDWPSRADGAGSTLELRQIGLPYHQAASWRSSHEYLGSPGRAGMDRPLKIYINEVLTHTDPPLWDSIELYNPNDISVDLSGWLLSDSTLDYQKFRIPAGTVLGPGQHVVFDEQQFNITSYSWRTEGAKGRVQTEDNGYTLRLTGDTWRKAPLRYMVTPATVLEFDFLSTLEGQFHGIGLDIDDQADPGYANIFKLYGARSAGITDFADYASSAPEWKHYVIPIGQYYTGLMNWMVLANDADAPPHKAVSLFRNITLHEGAGGEAINFSSFFGLDGARGDQLFLIEPDQSGSPRFFIDNVDFGAARNAESIGRYRDAQGRWHFTALAQPTLGSPNTVGGNAPYVGSVVISEIMYHPGNFADADRLEFIELLNTGTTAVNLTNWRLRGGVDYDFRPGTILPAGGVLIVAGFDPADPLNMVKLANFRSFYGIGPSVQMVGGFKGKPANEGERIRLLRPDEPPNNEPNYYPGLTEDVVDYQPVSPWPVAAAGQGYSLTRVDAGAWGCNFSAWVAAAPSPGTARLLAGAYLLYNNSAFDGRDPAANPLDDNAIAIDKAPLRPENEQAGFRNYSSYSRGINGLIFDLAGLPVQPTLETVGQFFQFKVGNSNSPDTWSTAPGPVEVASRPAAPGSTISRITVLWNDSAIQNQWLQVTVLPGPETGLPQPVVLYFGNLVGDAGDGSTQAVVDHHDENLAWENDSGFRSVAITNLYDFNRDRRVTLADSLIARRNDGAQLVLLSFAVGQGQGITAGPSQPDQLPPQFSQAAFGEAGLLPEEGRLSPEERQLSPVSGELLLIEATQVAPEEAAEEVQPPVALFVAGGEHPPQAVVPLHDIALLALLAEHECPQPLDCITPVPDAASVLASSTTGDADAPAQVAAPLVAAPPEAIGHDAPARLAVAEGWEAFNIPQTVVPRASAIAPAYLQHEPAPRSTLEDSTAARSRPAAHGVVLSETDSALGVWQWLWEFGAVGGNQNSKRNMRRAEVDQSANISLHLQPLV